MNSTLERVVVEGEVELLVVVEVWSSVKMVLFNNRPVNWICSATSIFIGMISSICSSVRQNEQVKDSVFRREAIKS